MSEEEFLKFIERDMQENPANITELSEDLMRHIQELTKDVVVSEEDEL